MSQIPPRLASHPVPATLRVRELDAEKLRSAVRTVASHARDADDLAMLLDALGLAEVSQKGPFPTIPGVIRDRAPIPEGGHTGEPSQGPETPVGTALGSHTQPRGHE